MRPLDVGSLVPSLGGADEAAVARDPLPRVIAELVIGGASSDIRKEAAAVLKAVWRLLEGQSSVEAQQVLSVSGVPHSIMPARWPSRLVCSFHQLMSSHAAQVCDTKTS